MKLPPSHESKLCDGTQSYEYEYECENEYEYKPPLELST